LEDVRAIVGSRFPTVAIVEQRARPGIGAREIHLSATYANGYGKPYGNPLREWLRELGIFGQRDRDKRVPAFVFESGAVGAGEFLAGYLAADGCVTRSPSERWSVRFDTVSRRLAEDVCALLLRLGIVGTISLPQWNTASTRPIFGVTVAQSHQALLAPLIPVRGRKGRQLGELISSASRNLTNPGLFGLPRLLSTYVAERSREVAVASGGYGPGRSAADHGPLWRDQGKRMRREIAGEWSTQLDDATLARWADSDLLWESIRSIDPAGRQEVFDIRIPGAHNFVGNGIVAHNSGSIEQDSDIVIFLYRDEYYNPNTDQQGIAEVHVAKHRNGPTDTIKLRFRKDQTLFYNLESRRPEPEPV
jgi:replicative DNA helicase